MRHGQLWHIAWDPSSCTFAQTSSEERLLIAFDSGSGAKTLRLSFADTSLQGVQKLTPLLGTPAVEMSNDGAELLLANW